MPSNPRHPATKRRVPAGALLSILSMPAWAQGTCQQIDATGNPVGPPTGTVSGTGALACGDGASATAAHATALGSWVDLNGDDVVDPGEVTWAKGLDSTAIGAASQALGDQSVAIGLRAHAIGTNSVAIGNTSTATGNNSAAIGNGAQTQSQVTRQTSTTVVDPNATPNSVTTIGPATTVAGPVSTGSVAMGDQARANGSNNLALGSQATTEAVSETLVVTTSGTATTSVRTTIHGPVQNAIAMGNNARATGDGAIVIGGGALAEARVGQVISRNPADGRISLDYTKAPATNSTVLGTGAKSQGTNNVVIGAGALTSGAATDATGTILLQDRNSTVVGASAASVRGWGTALGHRAAAYGYQTTAIGTGTYAVGTGSTAVGGWFDVNAAFGAAPSNPPAFGYGFGTNTPGLASQAFGANARTWGNYDTALGPAARTSDFNSDAGVAYNSNDQTVINGSLAAGFVAFAEGHASIALGQQSRAHDAYAVALGSESIAWGIESLAIGHNAIASWHQDIAVGANAQALGGSGTGNIAFGTDALVDNATGGDTRDAIAMGTGARALADNAVAVGAGAEASGLNAIASGQLANASGESTSAYGNQSSASDDYASAFGAYAYAGNAYASAFGVNAFAVGVNSAAFGYNAAAIGNNSLALGYNASATHDDSVALGSDSNAIGATLANAAYLVGGGARAEVNIGNRRITSVAAGAQDDDAVNVAQLRATNGRVDNVETQLGEVGGRVGAVEGRMDATETGIAQLDDRVTRVQGNVTALQADVGQLKGDVTTLQGNVQDLDGRVDLVEGKVGKMDNAVLYDDATKGTATLNKGGRAVKVANVADGVAPHDAANVGQLQAGDAATLASAYGYTDTTAAKTLTRANAYTDSRFQALSDEFSGLRDELGLRLGRQDERIDRQGAMSSAMVNMAINAANARSPRGRVAVGAGWQNGESALSLGYSKAIGNRASFSIGGAFSSDDRSAGVGFGIDL